MACFKCKHTGEITCDPEEAEIKCMVCGRCEKEKADEKQTGN